MKTWHIIGILVVIALALWYVFGQQVPAVNTESSALEQTPALSSGDTTADIAADLAGAPDIFATLDADASASAAAAAGL